MAKKSSLIDKRTKKRQQLAQRTQAALNLDSTDAAIELLLIGRKQAVRVNTLKGIPEKTASSVTEKMGDLAQKSPLYKVGFVIGGDIEPLRDSHLQQDGFIYIQNAASWLPVLQLNPQPGEQVLDVCAAPGGKTSLIAALSGNQAKITANDNSRPRLMRLKANMERLNATVEEYALYDASRLANSLKGRQFDKVLLDAPCSGEGMMRYDIDKDFDSWSIAHVKRLGKLQRQIIAQAWSLLKPGGSLIYSTCTMAPEENEAVIDYLLRHNDDAQIIRHDYPQEAGLNRCEPVLSWNDKLFDGRIKDTLRLAPSQTAEAFFVCHLVKSENSAE